MVDGASGDEWFSRRDGDDVDDESHSRTLLREDTSGRRFRRIRKIHPMVVSLCPSKRVETERNSKELHGTALHCTVPPCRSVSIQQRHCPPPSSTHTRTFSPLTQSRSLTLSHILTGRVSCPGTGQYPLFIPLLFLPHEIVDLGGA